ncbi:nucleic-acid-binding protein from mobile element jockey [Elysia marginata]|uniref:Nucleic-acid-binding protein from mobile element jockey n=1 Tax=Elysia marginata TaxID=1093978 RepID=A0AAV4JEY5_9GAST|nr:nucleic-acid-binding protein from mobile element jockey [Elysia marginata]
MRCFKCHRFGHGRDRCRRNIDLCVKCGEPGHRGEECDRSHKCVNCKGDHPASSKNCPKYLEEQAALWYRAHNGGTFGQARAAVIVEVAKEVRPKLYAQAVRGGPARRPPPRAPAPEDSDSGDIDTDLGSALSADPRGCLLPPLVLIQPKRPPSLGPVKAAGASSILNCANYIIGASLRASSNTGDETGKGTWLWILLWCGGYILECLAMDTALVRRIHPRVSRIRILLLCGGNILPERGVRYCSGVVDLRVSGVRYCSGVVDLRVSYVKYCSGVVDTSSPSVWG